MPGLLQICGRAQGSGASAFCLAGSNAQLYRY
nr:MAG TPA: hypothetical protein [Bacteriophage sp.]